MKIIMPHAVVVAMYFLRDGSGREGGVYKDLNEQIPHERFGTLL